MLLPPLSGHSLVVLWTELAALVLLARVIGGLARRLGQPAVVGELVAGLLLGRSVLGHLSPTALHWFLPAGRAQGDLLTAVSQLALLVVLVVVGAETDLPLIRALGSAAGWVSAASLVIPIAAGVGAAEVLPASFRSGQHHAAYVLLIAGAVGISSLPVVARIMGDLQLLRRNFGQLSVAAGTANDVVGFLLVTAATGLAGAETGELLAVALGGLAVALVVVFTVGQWTLDALLRQVRRRGPNVAGSLTVAMVAAFAAAAATQAIGLEGALGGFLAGVALGRSRFQQGAAMEELTRFSDAVLAPLFFATAGLRVDLGVLGHWEVLVATVLLITGAMAAKFVSGLVGARLGGLAWRDGAALGVVLNGRGTMQVIIAEAGLAAGLLTTAAYSSVIVLALVSSLSVAPLLGVLVRRWRGTAEERARLDEERRLATNVVVRDERLLLAASGAASSMLAGAVLHGAWPSQVPVTVLAVGGEDDGVGRLAPLVFPGRAVEVTPVAGGHELEALLAETRLGYGVLAVGAPEVPGPEHILSTTVDEVVVRSPIPVVVARPARRSPPAAREGPGTDGGRRRARTAVLERQRGTIRDDLVLGRIVVPVAGTAASRAAQEIALGLAAERRSTVTLTHVVARGGRPAVPEARSAQRAGDAVLHEAERFAATYGVRVRGRRRQGSVPGDEIVRLAAEVDADVIVLGATARSLGGRPFLGHTVEQVLAGASCAVVLVVLPSDVPAEPSEPAAGT